MMETILKKFRDTDLLLSNSFLPLVVLIFNCLSFAYFHDRVLILPSGVNYVFASRLWKYGMVLSALVYLVLFVAIKSSKKDQHNFKHKIGKLPARDLTLVLLPLTPIVQYILVNQEILSPIDSISVLAFFLLFASLYTFLIPILLSPFGSTSTLMLSGLAFVFTINSMALLSQQFSWYESGPLWIQALFYGGTFLVLRLLYNPKHKRLIHIIIAAIFLLNTGFQFVVPHSANDRQNNPAAENQPPTLIAEREPQTVPNIYLLVYDGYVASETLFSYGIDNDLQERYLVDLGFKLYPHTYSIGSGTLSTISSLFSISNEDVGSSRKYVAGQGAVHTFLRSVGYQTYGLFTSDFFFRGYSSSYDLSLPENYAPPDEHLIHAVLMGEFRFDLGFDHQTREEFLEAKDGILADIPAEPSFIYVHSDLPNHSQNSGACLFFETSTYQERLTAANREMNEDLNAILGRDPGAIIIIAGDHGPYLTKNCTSTAGEYERSEISRLDIQDRYGTFLAIRWPTAAYEPYDEITVLQDLFPAIFSYLYQDAAYLDTRIEPRTTDTESISGASVDQGIISGGVNDGEYLFTAGRE